MAERTGFLLGWTTLLGAATLLFALVAIAAYWQHRLEVPSRSRRRKQRAEWERQAALLTEQAAQATVRAAACAAELASAEQASAVAWQDFEVAQAAHEAAQRRYQEAQRRSTGQRVDRGVGQEVAHAALLAYRRGDLSQEELWRVWSWGTGWDPELAEREQEVRALRAARREAHLRYRAAAGRERRARGDTEVAEVQARALAEEAAEAAEAAAGMARWS